MNNGFRKTSKDTIIKEQSELIEAYDKYVVFLLDIIDKPEEK